MPVSSSFVGKTLISTIGGSGGGSARTRAALMRYTATSPATVARWGIRCDRAFIELPLNCGASKTNVEHPTSNGVLCSTFDASTDLVALRALYHADSSRDSSIH